MGEKGAIAKTNIQFGSTEYADTVPVALSLSSGPVYLEGRLVLSLSFCGQVQNAVACKDVGGFLEHFRLWDDEAGSWYGSDLAVLRFEQRDVVVRQDAAASSLDAASGIVWTGAMDTHARVIAVPDLSLEGVEENAACDLCWKRV